MNSERVVLYRTPPPLPPGTQIIPAYVTPFTVDNYIHEEDEFARAVCRIRTNKAGGPSGMRTEHLRSWMGEATREYSPDPILWEKVIGLIRAAFREVRLTEECTCQTFVLILKRNGNFCGVGLVELLWNMVTGILNFRLTAAIQFHDTLHGFRTGRGTGIASLEAKMLHQMMLMREEVLY